ncbi:NAD(P)H-dependent glycerol-3-phosphate dehydrogenase [Desulfobulbus sp.]|uniref:NAD(P)H-dependent glycerol-3-phosphate dehydrogenase n=1 Tax=Desulfobulbus sp. TaxID=895 RepID=UPI00286F13ED|nr:NAD(P)H-dependent glycerol-3-phosphate dehydrogenase [Desulfobulbus sp.]
MNKIAMIGAGSWGTALALLLARKGMPVVLWDHDADHVARLAADRENKRYQPGHPFPAELQVTDSLAAAVKQADCVVMVVPSHGFRAVYRAALPEMQQGALVVSAIKGIEIESGMTMTQIMQAENDANKRLQFGVLSGPSFASEVAERQPTAVTVAFAEPQAAETVQRLFSTDYFRVYTSGDVIGLEISAAMKNVIAIAAGICDGLNYGLNTRAALITRGLAEIARLGVAMGGEPQTFAGLGGLGDLVLTCTGNLSRNRTVGLKLGSGLSLEQALSEMKMVAEGVKTTKSCYQLASGLGVEMPILEQMHQILYHGKLCQDAVVELFQRDLKQEADVANR